MKKPKKNPSYLKKPSKNPRQSEKTKNPRLDRKTQDLGRKPKGWQRWTTAQKSLEAMTQFKWASEQVIFITNLYRRKISTFYSVPRRNSCKKDANFFAWEEDRMTTVNSNVSIRTCYRNRKLEISTASTTENSRQPAYTQAVIQNKIDRIQRVTQAVSGVTRVQMKPVQLPNSKLLL